MFIPPFILWRHMRHRLGRAFLFLGVSLVGIGTVACDSSSPTSVGDGAILISGGCSARSADRSITCQDESTTAGTDVSLTSVVFDYQLAGLTSHSRQAGLGQPPRQVSVGGLEYGTWTIKHKVTGTQKGVPLSGERSYAVTLLSESSAQVLLEIIDGVDDATDQQLTADVQRALDALPPSTQTELRDYLRHEHRVDLRSASAPQLRALISSFGGRFGLRTMVLIQSAG